MAISQFKQGYKTPRSNELLNFYFYFTEEDSEPILGLWFEETLDSSDGPPSNTAKENNEEANTDRNATVVPDNREPHGV